VSLVTQAIKPPLVLIITGPPAGGKTTLGRQLATCLRLPFLNKDLFKEALYDHLGWSDRDWSRRLGAASVELLYRAAAALLEAGQSVAVESNFYAEWDAPRFRQLAEQFGCHFIQVVCTASGPTLVERYKRRIESGERHRGHTESDSLDDILSRLLTECWDALDLEGRVFYVDTGAETPIDVRDLAHAVRVAAKSSERTHDLHSC
jgi:predicted kinase